MTVPARLSFARRLVIAFIRLYQKILSPFIGGQCRFHPTCSNYAILCFQTLPLGRAFWLSLRRIGRCHPGTEGGEDFPPPPDSKSGA